MKRLVCAVVLAPLAYLVACSSSETGGSHSSPTDGGADAPADSGADADADSSAKPPSVLDSLDPSQGPFATELASVRAMTATLAAAGAGTVDRLFVGGDPLLVGAAAERVVHVGSADCANSPYGCPSRVPADEVLAQFATSRPALRAALLAALDGLERLRWVAAAHTAIGFANLLDQTGKLSASDKAALSPKFTALAGVKPALAEFQFAQELPASFTQVKALYALTDGVLVPAPATAAAAKEVVASVASLLAPLGAKPGSFAPFAEGAAPVSSSPALATLKAATLLPAMAAEDPAKDVDAYLLVVDAIVDKAAKGNEATIDWNAYAAALDALDAHVDRALIGFDAHVPPPGPPPSPSSSSFAAPPTEAGTLENDPRAALLQMALPATCLHGEPVTPVTDDDVVRMRTPDVGSWSTAGAVVTTRRFPVGTSPSIAATPLPSPVDVTPMPVSCYVTNDIGVPYALVNAAACGVPIRFVATCFGKFTMDHVEVIVRRGESGPVLLRHVYRPKADGSLPAMTWFLPRIDDPALAKDAFNAYRVDVTTVSRGGASDSRCVPVYWPEGTPTGPAPKNPCTAPPGPVVDLFADPTLPTSTFVVEKYGAGIRLRPAVDAFLATGDFFKVENRSGASVELVTMYSAPFADATGLSTTVIGTVARFETGPLADGASKTIATPPLSSKLAPHRWVFGRPGTDGILAQVFATNL
ncbi:MAG: hypothetical protein HYZ29_21405 [Myxococcales bacterium]|nr:hypothetical protein [Myxococcales bacterium]